MESSESDQLKLAQARRMRQHQKVYVVIGLGLAFMAFVIFWPLCQSIQDTTVVTKRSPDGRHTAKLTRTVSIDVNLHLTVDGERVYDSPDIYPDNTDCREQLMWSIDNRTVVLEVAGHRIFGYQAAEKRNLSESELSKVEFRPFSKIFPGGVGP